jgi:hypothetical protein
MAELAPALRQPAPPWSGAGWDRSGDAGVQVALPHDDTLKVIGCLNEGEGQALR